MFEKLKVNKDIDSLRCKLLIAENEKEIKDTLLNLIERIKKYNIPFLRDSSIYPVFWTNDIKDLSIEYTDTLTSPAMIFCRSLLEDVVIQNQDKNKFWHDIFLGTLEQDKNNNFTRMASELYSEYIIRNPELFSKIVILDNSSICKIEHILVRDELPLLVNAYRKNLKDFKKIPEFLNQIITITSRGLLPDPNEIIPNKDKEVYVSVDIPIIKINPKYSQLELKLILREKDKYLSLQEEKLAKLEKRIPKFKINSWYAKVRQMYINNGQRILEL